MTADSTMLLERIHKQFECSICTNTLKTPSQLQCGHVFCSGCLTELQKAHPIKKNTTPCPLCKDTFTRRSVKSRDDITKLFYEFEKLKFAHEKYQAKLRKPIKAAASSSSTVIQSKDKSNSNAYHNLDNVIPKTKAPKSSNLFDFEDGDSPQTSTASTTTANTNETSELTSAKTTQGISTSTTTVECANINDDDKKKKKKQDNNKSMDDYNHVELNEPISDVLPTIKQFDKVQEDKKDDTENKKDEGDDKAFNEKSPSKTESSPTFEFFTASGKAVTVSQAALDQVKNMWRVELENDDEDSTIIEKSNKDAVLPEKSTTTTTTTDVHQIDFDNDDESLSELPGTPPSPISKIHKQDNVGIENLSVETTMKSKKHDELLPTDNNNEPIISHSCSNTVRRSQEVLGSKAKSTTKLETSQNITKNSKKTLPVYSGDDDAFCSPSLIENVPLDLSIKLSNSQQKEREHKRPKLAFQHLSPSLALDLSCKRLRSDEEEDDSTTTEHGKSYYGNSFNVGNQVSCPSYSRRNSNKKMKSSVCKSLDDEFLKYGNEKGIITRKNQVFISRKDKMDENVENLSKEKEVESNQNSIPKGKEGNSYDDAMTCRGDQFLGNLDMDAMMNVQTTSPMGMKKRERSTGEGMISSPSSMGAFKKLRTSEKEVDDIHEENKQHDATKEAIKATANIMESPRRRPPVAVMKEAITPNQENDYDSDDSDDSFLASTPTREAKLLNKSSKLTGEVAKPSSTTTTTAANKLQMPTPISPLGKVIRPQKNSTMIATNTIPPGSILKTPANTNNNSDGSTNRKNNHYIIKTPPSSSVNRPGCFSPPSAYRVETTDLFEGFNDEELDAWSDFESKSMEEQLEDGAGEKENGPVDLVENINIKTKNEVATTTTTGLTSNNTIVNFQTPRQWGSPIEKNHSLQQLHQAGMTTSGNRAITSSNLGSGSPMQLIASQLVSRKFVFCFTRLSKAQQATLQEFCGMCDGTVTRDYTDDVSHLVLTLENQRVPQTMKYLLAIAGKKWVVVFDWVEECLAQNRIVSEEKYETANFLYCDQGVKESRMAKILLFEGFTFYVLGKLTSSGATSDLWRSLLRKLGARVVTNPEEVTKDILIVGDTLDKNEGYQDWYEKHEVITVAWEWILDCTLAYERIPLQRRYTITKMELRKNFSKLSHPNFPLDIYPTV